MEDSPLQIRSLTSYFESARPTAFSTKVTVESALKKPDAAECIEAMKIEMDQMRDTGTLEAMKLSMLEPGATIINFTMVLVQKPDKKKARLCACGDELRGKTADYWSPNLLNVHKIALIDQIDSVGAYLYQSYPESSSPIYIRIPAKVMSALQIAEDTVYRIKKYICGLPDSGRVYYLAYAKFSRMRNTRRRRAIFACSIESMEMNVSLFGFMLTIHLWLLLPKSY